MNTTKHRLIAIRFPDGLPETEPLCIVRQATFDQAKAALKDACLTYAVHGDQPPQKWLDALAAMEAL